MFVLQELEARFPELREKFLEKYKGSRPYKDVGQRV